MMWESGFTHGGKQLLLHCWLKRHTFSIKSIGTRVKNHLSKNVEVFSWTRNQSDVCLYASIRPFQSLSKCLRLENTSPPDFFVFYMCWYLESLTILYELKNKLFHSSHRSCDFSIEYEWILDQFEECWHFQPQFTVIK